jgi:hypothetical protein
MSLRQIFVELPDWPRMLRARNFHEFWQSLTNDQIYVCQGIFSNVTGRSLYIADADPSDWDDFTKVVNGLYKATHIFNYAAYKFSITFDEDATWPFSSLSHFELWVDHAPASDTNLVVKHILHNLIFELRKIYPNEVHYPAPFVLDYLYLVKFLRPHSDFLPDGEFDIFISYKTRDYASMARTLATALTARGLRCWFDQDQLVITQQGTWIDTIILKKYLAAALDASQLTIFFETYSEAIADEDFRGNTVSFNYQAFEHRHARKLIYIRPKNTMIDFGTGAAGLTFQNEEELASKIWDVYQQLSDDSNQAGNWRTRERKRSAQELQAASDKLLALARKYFSHDISLSARMTMIMLSPGSVDQHGQETTVLGDDILMNLLRYSPFCALILLNAGIDLSKLFAVGAKEIRNLWSAPGSYRFPDTFGPADSRKEELANLMVMDEAELLKGMVGLFPKNYAATQLMIRTLKHMGSLQAEEEEETTTQLGQIVDHVSNACRRGYRPCPGQQWILFLNSDGIRFRPFAECGKYKVTGLQGPDTSSFSVNLMQTDGIFDEQALLQIETLLERREARELDKVLASYPVLDFLLQDFDSIVPTSILVPLVKDGLGGSIFLFETFSAQVPKTAGTRTGRSIGETLVWARSLLPRQLPGETSVPNELLSADWHTGPAIIFGAESCSMTAQADWMISLSSFDLQWEVLAPLWHYQNLTQLDYDEF